MALSRKPPSIFYWEAKRRVGLLTAYRQLVNDYYSQAEWSPLADWEDTEESAKTRQAINEGMYVVRVALNFVGRAPRCRWPASPRAIAGHARDRYVYAPVDGVLRTKARIGDAVRRGEEVARVGDPALHAPLDGVLRGLTHDDVPIAAGTKVIEVDPRGRVDEVRGIGERPRRIAEGVLSAMRAWERRLRP
jgi:hypothetical protein